MVSRTNGQRMMNGDYTAEWSMNAEWSTGKTVDYIKGLEQADMVTRTPHTHTGAYVSRIRHGLTVYDSIRQVIFDNCMPI